MNKETKIICVAAGLCVLGAVVVDCGLFTTGATLIVLGILGLIVGPLLPAFDKEGK